MKRLVSALALSAALIPAHASSEAPGLRAEILAADAELFGALNARDLATMGRRFSPRLEFYHDRSGLTDYAANLRAFEQMFSRPQAVRREAMNDSVSVYPAGPGHAMHVGSHRFCSAPAPGAAEECSVYGFAMVWAREDGQWKLLRVLSYGH